MPKAIEIANELRRIADALEREPEAQLIKPMLSFYNSDKAQFMLSARLLPRPLAKEVTEHEYTLENGRKDGAVWLRTKCDRNKVCTLVTPAIPAVYECPPLLSEAEEALLEVGG